MTHVPVVRVAMSGISQQVKESGGDEALLLFRPSGHGPRDALVAVEAAIAAADAAVPPESVWGGEQQRTPKGVMLRLKWPGGHVWRVWVEAFAGQLEQDGWSGAVGPVRPAWFPRWLRGAAGFWMTGFVACSMAPGTPLGVHGWAKDTWGIDEATTEALCRETVEWSTIPGSGVDVYFADGSLRFLVSDPGVSQMLATALRHNSDGGVTCVRRTPLAVRHVRIGPAGSCLYQVEDPSQHWAQRVADIRVMLLRAPERLDIAFIRTAGGLNSGWGCLNGGVRPRSPHVSGGEYAASRFAWPHYVLDAHGIQVLTAEHLAKTNDLSRWHVRELAGGRYLVQARDLHPWYSGPEADPDVVQAARDDFADAIATPRAMARLEALCRPHWV